jgi:hypothetical protein
VVSVTDPYGRILDFIDRSRYISIEQLLRCTHKVEWTPIQTHYFLLNKLPSPNSRYGDHPGAYAAVLTLINVLCKPTAE